jgi:hypothetical protein
VRVNSLLLQTTASLSSRLPRVTQLMCPFPPTTFSTSLSSPSPVSSPHHLHQHSHHNKLRRPLRTRSNVLSKAQAWKTRRAKRSGAHVDPHPPRPPPPSRPQASNARSASLRQTIVCLLRPTRPRAVPHVHFLLCSRLLQHAVTNAHFFVLTFHSQNCIAVRLLTLTLPPSYTTHLPNPHLCRELPPQGTPASSPRQRPCRLQEQPSSCSTVCEWVPSSH